MPCGACKKNDDDDDRRRDDDPSDAFRCILNALDDASDGGETLGVAFTVNVGGVSTTFENFLSFNGTSVTGSNTTIPLIATFQLSEVGAITSTETAVIADTLDCLGL